MSITFSGLTLLAVWCVVTALLNLASMKLNRASLGGILLNLLLLIAGILIFIGK